MPIDNEVRPEVER